MIYKEMGFKEFVEMIQIGEEPEFYFRDGHYAISQYGEKRFFAQYGKPSFLQEFETPEDCIKNARIEGLTLEEAFPEFGI